MTAELRYQTKLILAGDSVPECPLCGALIGDTAMHNRTHDTHEPMLGLATTRELLNEVAVRMDVTQNSLKGSDLGRLCREAIKNLDVGVLDYRTVAS